MSEVLENNAMIVLERNQSREEDASSSTPGWEDCTRELSYDNGKILLNAALQCTKSRGSQLRSFQKAVAHNT